MALPSAGAPGRIAAEDRLDRLVSHPALGGPELSFVRARLAQLRGDTAAARKLAQECLQKLPEHNGFAGFAVQVGAELPASTSRCLPNPPAEKSPPTTRLSSPPFGDDTTALVMYDTETVPVKTAPCAECVTVTDGKITYSRSIFDLPAVASALLPFRPIRTIPIGALIGRIGMDDAPRSS